MIITDLKTIDRLAKETYASHPIFSVDLADYANLKGASVYIKAAKLETSTLTKQFQHSLLCLIREEAACFYAAPLWLEEFLIMIRLFLSVASYNSNTRSHY